MSRCFPFPPPSYANKGEALGELIKLQREKEEAKSKRKEKKLKKLRKEDKKQRSIPAEKAKKQLDDEKYYQQKSKTDLISGYHIKSVEDESEQLEKSDLTEEYEQPTCSEGICFVSNNSTQSSKKRGRQGDSLANDGDSKRTVLRIRLPLRKHKEPDTSSTEQNKKIRLSKESAARVKENSDFGHIPSVEKPPSIKAETNTKIEKLTLKSCLELPLPGRESTETKSDSKASLNVGRIQSPDSLHRTLIENWVPPGLELVQNDLDDQDWLFGSKQQKRRESKIHKVENVASCSRSSTLWPQANYLPEVDVYSLPYTVPF